jgi:hypothetical protein
MYHTHITRICQVFQANSIYGAGMDIHWGVNTPSPVGGFLTTHSALLDGYIIFWEGYSLLFPDALHVP